MRRRIATGLVSAWVWALAACTRPPNPAPESSLPVASASPASSASSASSAPVDGGAAKAPGSIELVAQAFPLPGTGGPISVDYIACDRPRGRVWIPVGETGSVDVFDLAAHAFTRVDGFKTAEREVRGKKRALGPSAVSVGEGVVYVGDRATGEVCPVDQATLKLGRCLTLPTNTDGVVYVASTREVWVTTPRDSALTVLDATKPDALKAKSVIHVDGSPEGYAVDSARGVFYTNLEDKNRTVAIDVRTHAVKSTWNAGCGVDGPRGLALDVARNLVIVACTDGVRVLDGNQGGATVGTLDVGGGVDNLDYVEESKTLVVAAGRAATVVAVHVGDRGTLSVVATGVTAAGARNAVVDPDGNIYVVDPGAARLLAFAARR